MTNIYFIRHAESEFIHDRELERGITKDGLIKSKQIAKQLDNISFSAIFSSTYRRAIETVKPLANRNALNIETFDELIERSIVGLDYHMEWSEVEKAIEISFMDIDYCLKGGETTRAAQYRSIPIVKKILKKYKGKSIAIGTHGNIMTIILKYFDNSFGYEFWKNSKKPDIFKLSFKDDQLLDVTNIPI